MSINLRPDHLDVPGRTGNTLCGADARDEENANYWLSRWSSRHINVAALPPCKRCAKAAEKRGRAS